MFEIKFEYTNKTKTVEVAAEGGGNALLGNGSHYPSRSSSTLKVSWVSMRSASSFFTIRNKEKSIPTLDEMNRVMLAYLDCPQ